MGRFVNPGNSAFKVALASEIYIDKTNLLDFTNSVLGTKQAYICNSRPRRFGKSITADMLTAYYSKGCDSRELFSGLEIAKDESFEEHLNKYDTIFLNMQEFLSRSSNVKELLERVEGKVIRELKKQYPDVELYDENDLAETMQDIFAESECPFIVIIDEWDCIFREFKHDKAAQEIYLDFLRDLLKDKEYIYLAYMTGILPIKKYGTHSALNMFDEFSMIDPGPLAEYVGFTEKEVEALCQKYQMDINEIKNWYDGYSFEEALDMCLNMKNEEYARSLNRCPSETFLLIRKNDNKIIGTINVRWNLTEEMKKFGGNIGYSIRPTERRKGYNKINLYLGLIKANKLNLDRVMLDCDVNNIGSDRTMKALGGVLERTEIDPYDGILTNVYWFDVKKCIDKYKDVYEKFIDNNNYIKKKR